MKTTINSTSVDFTKELGKKLAKVLKKGDTIVLSGNLGAGKTMLVSRFFKLLWKRK